jgi:hypothetical protein
MVMSIDDVCSVATLRAEKNYITLQPANTSRRQRICCRVDDLGVLNSRSIWKIWYATRLKQTQSMFADQALCAQLRYVQQLCMCSALHLSIFYAHVYDWCHPLYVCSVYLFGHKQLIMTVSATAGLHR